MAHLMRSALVIGLGKDDDGMSLDEGRQSQRPYRYGMVLLCAGALINWLGLAEDYAEPVRYVGVACIVAGALLICAAMCCWLQSPARQPQHDRASPDTHQIDDPIHVISMPDDESMQQKPPDYDTVAGAPPTYDDAIKLNPARLLQPTSSARHDPAPPIPGQLDDAGPPRPPPPRRTPLPSERSAFFSDGKAASSKETSSSEDLLERFIVMSISAGRYVPFAPCDSVADATP